MRKIGTIGDFWARPKKEIWADVQKLEKEIAEGLKKPHMKELVEHVADLLAPFDRKQIERRLGRRADNEDVRAWIDQLIEKGLIQAESECACPKRV